MEERKLKKIMKLINEFVPQYDMKDVPLDTNLIENLFFDSIMMMELVIRIEEEFDILIEDDLSIDKLGTIRGICSLLTGDKVDE